MKAKVISVVLLLAMLMICVYHLQTLVAMLARLGE